MRIGAPTRSAALTPVGESQRSMHRALPAFGGPLPMLHVLFEWLVQPCLAARLGLLDRCSDAGRTWRLVVSARAQDLVTEHMDAPSASLMWRFYGDSIAARESASISSLSLGPTCSCVFVINRLAKYTTRCLSAIG